MGYLWISYDSLVCCHSIKICRLLAFSQKIALVLPCSWLLICEFLNGCCGLKKLGKKTENNELEAVIPPHQRNFQVGHSASKLTTAVQILWRCSCEWQKAKTRTKSHQHKLYVDYVCMYIYIYTCIHIYIYIYIYTCSICDLY